MLSGVNTYTGSTTVSGGILKLAASECLADAGTLTINGGKLELAAGVGERIDNLILGSITQTTNTTYGSFASSAEIQDDTRFAGTGMLFLGMIRPRRERSSLSNNRDYTSGCDISTVPRK